jgi:RNA polymerase primary sigma factor
MKSLKIQESITNRDTRSLKTYYNELTKFKLLTADEEYEIAYKAFNGDEKCRDLLVKHNLRFVISVAKQYETKSIKLEDLINEGNVGLVMASSKFDPSRGFKFLTYGVWWIRRYILSYISENSKTIRLPNNKINSLAKIKIEFNKLEQRLERQPSFNEMVSECNSGFSEDEIDFYFSSLNNHMSSLDKEIGNEGSTATMVDLMKDDESLEPSSYLDDSDREYRQNSLLNLLDTELEKEVINLLFGLDGQTPIALKTIGFLMGLTSERVRQIRDISIRKLKVSLTK